MEAGTTTFRILQNLEGILILVYSQGKTFVFKAVDCYNLIQVLEKSSSAYLVDYGEQRRRNGSRKAR